MLEKINGKNLMTVFGTYISDGMATLLTMPKLKEPVLNNWSDQDGIDIDLTEPKFEARKPKLKFTLTANSRALFKQYYYGLFNEFRQANGVELYIDDIDQTFFLYYEEMSGLKKLSSGINTNHVGVEFEVTFGERDPYSNIPQDYLTDEDDNYILI